MYNSLRQEVPEFIKEYLVYCDGLVDAKRKRSCLVLTRNLQFFEFQRKRLLASIDLNGTCLQKEAQRIREYKGPNTKWSKQTSNEGHSSDTGSVEMSDTASTEPHITFGKYVYHNFGSWKTYVLLRCWDKLVVLLRGDSLEGFTVQAEYENISGYQIVPGEIKFHTNLKLQFLNGDTQHTDFTEARGKDGKSAIDLAEEVCNKDEFKQVLERVTSAKAELQLHRSMTSRSFERLLNVKTFGVPFLRSLNLEEKQMLARCGDIWIRLTDQNLVLGVPLVNNCSPPNITILRNLRPLLQFEIEDTESVCYEYRLFQLRQRFDQLDSLETYFQSEDEHIQQYVWTHKGSEQGLQLLPESFAVMVIKFRISQIAALQKCPLILVYEIAKDLMLYNASESLQTYEMQLFLQTIDFHDILSNRHDAYRIKFSPRTLHQDFLALAMMSVETKLNITFQSQKDVEVFESLLIKKFDFDIRHYEGSEKVTMSQYGPRKHNQMFPHSLFFNNKVNSLWYGVLVLRMELAQKVDSDQPEIVYKFYTKSEEKAFLLIKILLDDLLVNNCNVSSIRCPENEEWASCASPAVALENALRQELCSLMEVINKKPPKGSKEWESLIFEFLKCQMKTDMVVSRFEGNSIDPSN